MLAHLQNLFTALDFSSMSDALLRAISVLLCLSVHETCHGLAALALGDPTAKSMHRLSLNPLRHIDWVGMFMMFAVGFGWAKPVPVDPRYFKDPKKGMAVTALAGPVSNLVLAAILLFACKWITLYGTGAAAVSVFQFLLNTAVLSVGLGVFNLIPIPPLDGSKVLGAFLSDRAYFTLMRYERYGMLVLLALSFLGVGSGVVGRAISAVWNGMVSLILL